MPTLGARITYPTGHPPPPSWELQHGRQINTTITGPRSTPSGTTYSTRQTLYSPGTYSGLTFNKGLTIAGDNITVEDCYIGDDNNADFANLIVTGQNVLVQYCEIDNHQQVYYGIAQRGGSAAAPNIYQRNDIHDGGFGINGEATNGWQFIENYVHDICAPSPAPYPGDDVWHADAIIAWGSDVTIQRNKLLVPITQTGVINFGIWSGSVSHIANVVIDSNYLAGAGFVFYVEEKDNPTYRITGMRITNNDFGQDYYPSCGYYGYFYQGYPPVENPIVTGNRLVTAGGVYVSDVSYYR